VRRRKSLWINKVEDEPVLLLDMSLKGDEGSVAVQQRHSYPVVDDEKAREKRDMTSIGDRNFFEDRDGASCAESEAW